MVAGDLRRPRRSASRRAWSGAVTRARFVSHAPSSSPALCILIRERREYRAKPALGGIRRADYNRRRAQSWWLMGWMKGPSTAATQYEHRGTGPGRRRIGGRAITPAVWPIKRLGLDRVKILGLIGDAKTDLGPQGYFQVEQMSLNEMAKRSVYPPAMPGKALFSLAFHRSAVSETTALPTFRSLESECVICR